MSNTVSEDTYQGLPEADHQEHWGFSFVLLADASRRPLRDAWVDNGPLHRGSGLDTVPYGLGPAPQAFLYRRHADGTGP